MPKTKERIEEERLINEARDGNEESFSRIESLNRDKIKGAIANYARNPTDTEDLYQATISKAWQKIGKFKNDSAFSTWAIRIGINLLKDERRSTQFRQTIHLETLATKDASGRHEIPENKFLDYYGSNTQITNRGLRNLELREVKEEIKLTLSSLSARQREVLSLYAIHELDYRQIAKRLRIPIGTVMSRIFYARKSAKKFFMKLKDARGL